MDPSGISHSGLVEEARRLLDSLEEGSMSETAYDTAWVARVPNPDNPQEPLFPAAFDWLLRAQRADGSWGAEIPFAHDRVISTLASLITLAGSSYRREEAQLAARRAIVYLNRERPNLQDDPVETVGFELILPELVRQAGELGLSLPYDDWKFVEAIKADKLNRIPPIAVYGGPTSLTHSLEYLGDRLSPTLVQRCQLANGSYGVSPSATAYVHARVPDGQTTRYLERVAGLKPSGGTPYVHPFEIFETSWVLYCLEPLPRSLPEVLVLTQRLASAWSPVGTAWTAESSVPDADDTAVALWVLNSYGHRVDTAILERFEAAEYFLTFAFERNPSVTTNAHVLAVLRQQESTPDRRRMILKAVQYLRNARVDGTYWRDKWHVSPYYATDQALAALSGLADELVRPAISWILDQQADSGAWGFGDGTQEETAWALHALIVASERDPALRSIARPAVERGGTYLADCFDEPRYPALWVGKSLYTPQNIVRAIVLGALARWHEAAGMSS